MSMFSPAYDNKIFASHELMASYYSFWGFFFLGGGDGGGDVREKTINNS